MQSNQNTSKVGSTLDIKGWVEESGLQQAVIKAQAVVTGKRVYMLGGMTNDGVTDISQSAGLAGAGKIKHWDIGTSIKEPLFYSQAVMLHGKVYLMGGVNNETVTDNVYAAKVEEDGTLIDWSVVGKLPMPMSDFQSAIVMDYLYLFGGWDGVAGIKNVYRCKVFEEGGFGKWEVCTDLPMSLTVAGTVILPNRVFLIGGYSDGAPTDKIFSAPINPDGSLGAWVSEKPLPTATYGAGFIAYSNRVFMLGGHNGVRSVTECYSASISQDGVLGEWVKGTSLPKPVAFGSVVITSNSVYLLGGDANSNNYLVAPFDGWDLV